MQPLDNYIRTQLNEHLHKIEETLKLDILTIVSLIIPPLDAQVKKAIEEIEPKNKNETLGIILETDGGLIEVAERIVQIVRRFYKEVVFIIPNRAMSAGTVFALSGDRILMNYFACLGPIDPQVIKDERLVPALSYLNQFEKLKEKSQTGQLTSAEYALLTKMDLGELYQYEQAKALTQELIVKWLCRYKFKKWDKTESRRIEVTDEFKRERAEEIADLLSDSDHWHSHGRSIDMYTLIEEVRLKIEDYHAIEGLTNVIDEYFDLLKDYINRQNFPAFIHTRKFF